MGVLVFIPSHGLAAPLSFSTDLKYGMYGSGAVEQLQDFLRTEGYFNADTTGNFLSLTLAAVRAWQAAHCVPATGYFGPLSRQAAATGTLCAQTTPSSSASSTDTSLGEGVVVSINGVAYVRTENGLVRISGGAPSHRSHNDSSNDDSDDPAPTYTVTASGGDSHESITPDTAQTVEQGSTQSFTVAADSGYALSGTVGGTCPAGSWNETDTIYTTGAITEDCTVSFSSDLATYSLTVTKAGPGSGNITSTPSGIACGSTCSASFSSGTTVTLTAFATDGFFNGWSGGGCSGLGTCVVTMDAAKAITATFQTLEPS
jgi:peptidoglycan hydrolase-like protein with peptidoglycan-binding domain